MVPADVEAGGWHGGLRRRLSAAVVLTAGLVVPAVLWLSAPAASADVTGPCRVLVNGQDAAAFNSWRHPLDVDSKSRLVVDGQSIPAVTSVRLEILPPIGHIPVTKSSFPPQHRWQESVDLA